LALRSQSSDPAFPTQTGARRDKDNLTRRVIAPAVRAANALRAERHDSPLPEPVTAHTFRRTFITLKLEAGAPVPYVQAQVGHQDATTTLKIYAQVLRRCDRKRHGQAFDALMSNAVPSAASIMMPTDNDQLREEVAGDMPMLPSGWATETNKTTTCDQLRASMPVIASPEITPFAAYFSVEPAGLEPATSCVQSRRSPN
jgi:hypothetical protein